MAHSVVLSGLERNCGLTMFLKMGNRSYPLIAYRLLQELQIAHPPGEADAVLLAELAIILHSSPQGRVYRRTN